MFNFNKNILYYFICHLTSFLVILASQQEIIWNGNWAYRCNFTTSNLRVENLPLEKCGPRCASVYGCYAYTWTDLQNGTCYMKRGYLNKKNVSFSNDQSSVCGVVEDNPVVLDIYTAHHPYINDEGACRLPIAEYTVNNPVALGNKETLEYIKFRPQLCGHILEIDCGYGKLDLIVMNSNYGGGLDLYDSSWTQATLNKKPLGETRCSVVLTKKNPFRESGYKCFHGTDETDNIYYRSVGLFNTNGKVVVGAQFLGRNGTLAENGYFSFYNYGTEDDMVTFFFEFGGSHSVYLKDCPKNMHYQKWS